MYSIESEKFNLEEEFQRMKKENEELRNKLTRYEKETTEVETQTEQEESTSSTRNFLYYHYTFYIYEAPRNLPLFYCLFPFQSCKKKVTHPCFL